MDDITPLKNFSLSPKNDRTWLLQKDDEIWSIRIFHGKKIALMATWSTEISAWIWREPQYNLMVAPPPTQAFIKLATCIADGSLKIGSDLSLLTRLP